MIPKRHEDWDERVIERLAREVATKLPSDYRNPQDIYRAIELARTTDTPEDIAQSILDDGSEDNDD